MEAHQDIDPAKAKALLGCMEAVGSVSGEAQVTYLEQLEGGWSRHSYSVRVRDEGEERAYIVRARPQGSTPS